MECQRKMVLLTHLRTYSLWFIIIFYEPLSFSILGHCYGTSEYTTMLKIYQWYVINVVCLSQDQEGVRLHSSVLPLILRLFFFKMDRFWVKTKLQHLSIVFSLVPRRVMGRKKIFSL